MATLILSAALLAYLAGWAVHLHHFHSKFKQCIAGWAEANGRRVRAEQLIYQRATRLAHNDTAMAAFWPFVVSRWKADYVAEARQLEQKK